MIFKLALFLQLGRIAYDRKEDADLLTGTLYPIPFENLYSGVCVVLDSLKDHPSESLQQAISRVKSLRECAAYLPTLTEELSTALRALFIHPEFLKAKEEIYRLRLVHYSFVYYFEKFMAINNWGLKSYRKHFSMDDRLQIHVRTSGVLEIDLPAVEGHRLRVWDTGGQRCERRKWSRTFKRADVFVYVASLSEYDEVLYEDSSKNRMEEAMDTFEAVLNEEHTRNRPVYLVLVKHDLLMEKLEKERVPLNASGQFPQAPKELDTAKALDWIIGEYKLRSERAGRTITKVTTMNTTSYEDVNAFIRDLLRSAPPTRSTRRMN